MWLSLGTKTYKWAERWTLWRMRLGTTFMTTTIAIHRATSWRASVTMSVSSYPWKMSRSKWPKETWCSLSRRTEANQTATSQVRLVGTATVPLRRRTLSSSISRRTRSSKCKRKRRNHTRKTALVITEHKMSRIESDSREAHCFEYSDKSTWLLWIAWISFYPLFLKHN